MEKYAIGIMLILSLLIVGCMKELPEPDPDPDPDPTENECDLEGITYTNTISTIMSGCTASSCHASGSPNGSMEGYQDAKTFAGFGRILGALRHEAGYSPMPKNGAQLDDCTISKVEAWIDAGFPE